MVKRVVLVEQNLALMILRFLMFPNLDLCVIHVSLQKIIIIFPVTWFMKDILDLLLIASYVKNLFLIMVKMVVLALLLSIMITTLEKLVVCFVDLVILLKVILNRLAILANG